MDEVRTGRKIRAGLKPYRVRQSGPAFYQMMARLEKGLVGGSYTQEVVDGQIIKERTGRRRAGDGRGVSR